MSKYKWIINFMSRQSVEDVVQDKCKVLQHTSTPVWVESKLLEVYVFFPPLSARNEYYQSLSVSQAFQEFSIIVQVYLGV